MQLLFKILFNLKINFKCKMVEVQYLAIGV